MAQMLVRRIPDDVLTRLKTRAAGNGRSAEAEVRALIEQAVGDERRDGDVWDNIRRLADAQPVAPKGAALRAVRRARRDYL